MPRTDEQVQAWLLALEAERWDTSWRKPKPTRTHEPAAPVFTGGRNKPAVDKKKQQSRDRIMFHAGRYAQGATDPEAVSANAKLAKLIK